jgi:hypothetical protein
MLLLKLMPGDKAIWEDIHGQILQVHWDFDTRFFVRCYKLEKDVYDEINYNRVLDVIEYDIKNDFIVTRHEIEGVILLLHPYKTSEDAYWIPNQPESGIHFNLVIL